MSDFTESEGDNPDAIEQGGDDGPLGEDRNAVIEEPAEFYIDNLDLGIFNMKHYVFPRIKQFGQDMLRRMATMATDVGFAEPLFASAPLTDPSTVCYPRKTCVDEACRLQVCNMFLADTTLYQQPFCCVEGRCRQSHLKHAASPNLPLLRPGSSLLWTTPTTWPAVMQ